MEMNSLVCRCDFVEPSQIPKERKKEVRHTFEAKGIPQRSAIDTVESRLEIYVGGI